MEGVKECIMCGSLLKSGWHKYCNSCLKKQLFDEKGKANKRIYNMLHARGVKLGVTKKCCVCGALLDSINQSKCTDCLLDDACHEAKVCRTSRKMHNLYAMLEKRGYDRRTVDEIIAEEVGV